MKEHSCNYSYSKLRKAIRDAAGYGQIVTQE